MRGSSEGRPTKPGRGTKKDMHMWDVRGGEGGNTEVRWDG